MKVAVPRERAPGERRVALTPDAVAALVKGGTEVLVEAGAGDGAFHPDAAFEQAGARIVTDAGALYGQADVVLKVQKPAPPEVEQLREGSVLVAFLQALTQPGPHPAPGGAADHQLRHGGHPAHQPGAEDGRALLAGQHRRLQGRADRRRVAAEVLPDAHDRGRDRLRRHACWSSAPAWPGCRPSPPRAGSARRCGATTSGRW